MVSAISTPVTTPLNKPKETGNVTKTSIFYVNDEHSNLTNMEKIKSASDEFDAFVPANKFDKLKFSAGDFCLGQDPALNKLAVATQNSMGIMATAGGNHEFDVKKTDLVNILKDNKYKLLGINVEIPNDSDENKELNKEITKSYIQEQNGTKYGVIGILPFDFQFHVTDAKEYKDFNIIPIEKTTPLIQKEIDKLKEQGVNKIILLSHAGYESDTQIAQSVEGIDVIIGGHTHNLIKGIEEGKNLFYSKKTGEPTIITQAGKDGRYFGVLNLEFNENGVITSAQNNVNKTEDFPKSSIIKYFTDKFLGKAEVIGTIRSAENQTPTLIKENPNADFITDAITKELNVDITIMNSGNIRGTLEKGALTDRDLAGLTPFKNKMYIVRLTEPEVVNAIKVGAKSLTDSEQMPGLLQVSGLRYTITKSGELKEAKFLDKDGKETIIDVNNPNPFKTYRTGADFFMARGGNDYIPNKLDSAEAKFDFDKDKLVVDYIKKIKTPIDIKTDGRIQITD